MKKNINGSNQKNFGQFYILFIFVIIGCALIMLLI